MVGVSAKQMSAVTISELASRFCVRRFGLSSGQKYLLRRAAQSFEQWVSGAEKRPSSGLRPPSPTGRRDKAARVTLAVLTDDKVCAWLSSRCEQVSLATVKRERKDLLQLWRWGAKQRLCRGPEEIPVIKLPRRLPKAMEIDKLALCIQICAGLPGLVRGTKIPRAVFWPALLSFIYDTGCRIGAAMSVQRDEVCWERCSVSLSAESAKTDCEQIVNITPHTRSLLRRLTSFSPESVMLFPFPLSRSALHHTLRKVRQKAGMPKRREGFHRIRATHATIVTARLGIETAAQQLGHSSTQVTWDRYVDRAMLADFLSSARAVDVLPVLSVGSAHERQGLLF